MICKCSLCDNEFESPKKELQIRTGYAFFKDALGSRHLISNKFHYENSEKFICRDCMQFITKTCLVQMVNKVLY